MKPEINLLFVSNEIKKHCVEIHFRQFCLYKNRQLSLHAFGERTLTSLLGNCQP